MAAAVVAVAVLAPGASADKVIQAQTVWRFDASTYAIDQGELLTFRNGDLLSPGPHDVTASDKGADGKPLFKSKTIPNGQEAPVDGARSLKSGSYGFFCSIHPFMTATLRVSESGTPVPAAGTPAAAPAPDKTGPRVTASVATRSLRQVLQTRSVAALIGADEAAKVTLRLAAKIGRRTVRLGSVVAKVDRAKRATVGIRVNTSALRRLGRAKRATLVLTVSAADGAGNVSRKTVRRTVSR